MEDFRAVFLADDEQDPLRRVELTVRAPNVEDAELWAAEFGQINFPALTLDSIA